MLQPEILQIKLILMSVIIHMQLDSVQDSTLLIMEE